MVQGRSDRPAGKSRSPDLGTRLNNQAGLRPSRREDPLLGIKTRLEIKRPRFHLRIVQLQSQGRCIDQQRSHVAMEN
jgi:hypothetical protein